MEQTAPAKNARQRLMQTIIDLGSKAYNPSEPEESRAQGRREFDDFVQSTKTINVIAAFNILIRPGHVPPWLRSRLMETLTLAPLRPDGVRATLEFVFSVHPSSTVKVSEVSAPQKKGANITHEALEMASQLLSITPSSVTPDTWYAGVAPQLMQLLDGSEGPELLKTASYIIGFGILGRKASGAPGTAGWRYLAEPLLSYIRPPPDFGIGRMANVDSAPIIDLSKQAVVVSPVELATALGRLQSLVASHPNPGLCKRLLSPLLLPLWALSSWSSAQPKVVEKVCTPALDLLKIQLKLVPSPQTLLPLVQNIGYMGGYDRQKPEWIYAETKQGELQIVMPRRPLGEPTDFVDPLSLSNIGQKINKLLELVAESFSDADISTAFIYLLGRWLNWAQRSNSNSVIIKQETQDEQEPIAQLAEIKLLQAMMERFPEKIANEPKHILELVSQVLAKTGDVTDYEDEVIGVALSLLNMIVTAPGFHRSRISPDVLGRIETSLETISSASNIETSNTARNLSLLLRFRHQVDDSSDSLTTASTNRQAEDRKTYRLAVSYISQPDSPPPVKFEGLNMIASLIMSQSPILDIPGILVLMSSLIRDSEDYINLQVIRIYTLLTGKHPKAVTKEILDHYVDPKETASVDTRLRFGEALLQVVERLGETFTGEAAQQVCDALLSVAGRRGYRPKTEARQAKEERLRQMRNKEAEEKWEGEVLDLSEDMPEGERARNEIMSRIVEGWESKRGAEDVRIRASALSILGNAMETNIAGLGPGLVSTSVDLAVNILQIETEMEKGILRRAAVLLVMSFVRSLDKAKQMGRRLGFGLAAREDIVRTLGYVTETDNDGLVRQHAADVLESLENLEMGKLTVDAVEGQRTGAELTRLVGLEVKPERSISLQGVSRPKIEEIE